MMPVRVTASANGLDCECAMCLDREAASVRAARIRDARLPKRRMTMPHPGEGVRRRARVLFDVEDPTPDQCRAAVDHTVYMQAAGLLPEELSGPRFVIHPDRPGRESLGQRSPLCACGLSRCTRRTRLAFAA